MNEEVVSPLTVQALWVSQAIGVLLTVGMVCYLLADVLRAATGGIKK